MSVRKSLAILLGKIGNTISRIIFKRGSQVAAKIAMKIYPNIYEEIDKPELVIAVTGTNGKTSVNNLLLDLFEKNGEKVLCNKEGSNLVEGILNTLIMDSNLKGELKTKKALFEVDERVSPLVYKHMTPDYLILTNLSRDSISRNANAEYIAYILEHSIPKETKIITNGDDIIASLIGKENEKIFFSIDRLPTDKEEQSRVISDFPICPVCNEKIYFEYIRINHQGKCKCPNEHVKNPTPDIEVKNINFNKEEMTVYIRKEDKEYIMPIISKDVFNIYNQLAVLCLALELGYSVNEMSLNFKNMKITDTRYDSVILGNGVEYVKVLCKRQNPLAQTNVFNSVMNKKGKKAIVLYNYTIYEDLEKTVWHYDSEFEVLNDESLEQLILVGPTAEIVKIRAILAGIPEEKIFIEESIEQIEDVVNFEDIESLYILHDLLLEVKAKELKEKLEKEFGVQND